MKRYNDILLFCFALIIGLSLWPELSLGSTEIRILSSSERSISFEIVVPPHHIAPADEGRIRIVLPGYGTFSPPGAIELPGKTFRVAIPPSGSPQVTTSILEEVPLGPLRIARVPAERLVEGENGIPATERYYPPDPWGEGEVPPVVSAEEPRFLGRQRVLPIKVNPTILAETGVRLVRRLSVTVTYRGEPVRREIEPPYLPPISRTWERLYEKLLVNPDGVSKFRKPLLPRRSLEGPSAEGERLRIYIPETGLYAVRADSLIAVGLSPGLSTGQLALKKLYFDNGEPDLVREVDIPILVLEGSSTVPNLFDGDDRLIFYWRGIRDDVDAGDLDAMFTDDNILWLEEEVAGTMMPEGPPFSSTPGDPPLPFMATTRVRKDTYYLKNAVPGTRDFYFVQGPVGETEASIPFVVQHPVRAEPGTFTLTIRMQGMDASNPSAPLTFAVRNASGTNTLGTRSISGRNIVTFTLSDLEAGWLVDGGNELVITCPRQYAYLVNDFEIDYPALYVAHDDMLEFSVDQSPSELTAVISGFSTDRGTLIEITDPLHPISYTLTPGNFQRDGSTYRLLLVMEPATPRHFIVVGAGVWDQFSPSKVIEDTRSNLRNETGPYNTLIVSHGKFLPPASSELAGYAAWREDQGYRILMADVQDVFDEFNGGLPSCEAVKRFIDYGFDHWGVEFVLLVGDAQEDHKQINYTEIPYPKGSPPDYVPTYTFCVEVSGTYDDEVVAADRWYSFLTPDEDPDVFLGRFPVGELVELRALLTKIYRFEEPELDDTWRRRMVLFADDAWSGRGTDYRYRPYEREFEWSMDTVSSSIEASLPGGFDIQELWLSHWTDGAHPNQSESGPAVYSRANDSTRTYFTPYLVDRLNEGCLFFTFQGHANRSVLTTEAGFATYTQYDDMDSLYTKDPLVFIGIGCHISDFARYSELSRATYDGPNGDCFSEQFLFKPGSGAVGTYASDGFEYLSQNARFCEAIHRVIFQSPPIDSVPPRNEYTGAYWVLAEAIAEAEIEQISTRSYGYDQVFRYLLLGDPMLRIDTGPPLMKLLADWGAGFEEVPPDSFHAKNGTNDCTLHFIASDVIALGQITLEVDGSDWTDSLTIVRLNDQDKTYSRGYRAELHYTVGLDGGGLLFKVFTPEGREAGIMEIPVETRIRLLYNDYLEIVPGVESPPTGTFRLSVDFPAYLSQEPTLLIDGVEQGDISFTVPNPQDSLKWEAVFYRTFPAGRRVFTVQVGEFSKDFIFYVTGGGLVVEVFNFPNPFREGTNIVYTLNLPVDSGTIEIFNVSGRLIRRLEIPREKLDAASFLNPHSIYWDGRDFAGDLVANGTYIYVIEASRAGSSVDIKRMCVKLE